MSSLAFKDAPGASGHPLGPPLKVTIASVMAITSTSGAFLPSTTPLSGLGLHPACLTTLVVAFCWCSCPSLDGLVDLGLRLPTVLLSLLPSWQLFWWPSWPLQRRPPAPPSFVISARVAHFTHGRHRLCSHTGWWL